MSYREFQPPPGTERLIQALWWSEGGDGQLILPDGSTDVIFSAGAARVVGVMSRAVRVPSSRSASFGLRLHPWAARALLGGSASRFLDGEQPLPTAHPALAAAVRGVRSIAELSEALACGDWPALLGPPADVRVRSAVASLSLEAPPTIETLASAASITPRQLHRLFLEHVGLSPRHLARIFRLRRAVHRARGDERLAITAAHAGYADQAHLSREVRALTGHTPSQLRRLDPRRW